MSEESDRKKVTVSIDLYYGTPCKTKHNVGKSVIVVFREGYTQRYFLSVYGKWLSEDECFTVDELDANRITGYFYESDIVPALHKKENHDS